MPALDSKPRMIVRVIICMEGDEKMEKKEYLTDCDPGDEKEHNPPR
jgi:hypothetical protein